MLGSWWEFLSVFSCTWLLTHGRGQETTAVSNTTRCNDTKALDECWDKLPPIRDHGIPSNLPALENACKTFDSGMKCVDDWSKTCLSKHDQEKLSSSILGAQETYRFLCSDKKFQRDFLKYSDCYKRISNHWDECARKFIESLKRVDHSKDIRSLCCIRYRYLHCVTEAAHNLCSEEATKFLQKMAESLVRTNMRAYHPSQCLNVGERNCSSPSSAQSSTKFLSTSSLLHTVLSYPTKGLVNSLNVLQNLAFSDITAFFCALSREFSPYFSHHHRINLDEGNESQSCSQTASSSFSSSSSNNVNKGDTSNFAQKT